MEKTLKSALKDIKFVMNPDLDKYDGTVMFPEKLARANAMIAKHGLPKEIEEHLKQLEAHDKLAKIKERFEKYGLPKEVEEQRKKRKAEQAFWLKGTLNHADMPTNTFSIVAKTSDNCLEKTYNITTSSELVRKTVKEYWGDAIRVHIKPKGDIETATEFELIEVF